MQFFTSSFPLFAIVFLLPYCAGNEAGGPGILYNTYQRLYQKTGVFPDPIDRHRRVLLRNVSSGKCLSLGQQDPWNTYTQVIEETCDGSEIQSVRLDYAGDGYVTLRILDKYCVGAGYEGWSFVFVSTAKKWCEDSPTHQWAILQRGDSVVFRQRGSENCLSSWPGAEELYIDSSHCKQGDPHQLYQICDLTATMCWPPNST